MGKRTKRMKPFKVSAEGMFETILILGVAADSGDVHGRPMSRGFRREHKRFVRWIDLNAEALANEDWASHTVIMSEEWAKDWRIPEADRNMFFGLVAFMMKGNDQTGAVAMAQANAERHTDAVEAEAHRLHVQHPELTLDEASHLADTDLALRDRNVACGLKAARMTIDALEERLS